MQLEVIDWIVIAFYISFTIILGLWFTRRAGKNIEEYFVAGRSLPWWIAGTSLAATWFSVDGAIIVPSLVRKQGIYANWIWWSAATGFIVMVFYYAKLWRRSRVLTDAELIELRYSGKSASVLRVFSALYQGILRNCLIMGWTMLAMVKLGKILLGWSPEVTLIVLIGIALGYTVLSGVWGVVATDIFQFIFGISGFIVLAVIVINMGGGTEALSEKIANQVGKNSAVFDVFPNINHISGIEFLSYLCMIFVLWVNSAQGDGYIAQRLLSTKDEKQAALTTLWFSVAGIILITVPLVAIGYGSLHIIPLEGIDSSLLEDPEYVYPMLLTKLVPVGFRGLMVAVLFAAFISTIDTHLCFGASYLVNDLYKRFIKSTASEKHYIKISRISVVILMLLAAFTAWKLETVEQAWVYMVQLTAGLAVIYMLRWYWWRINAWAEISAILGTIILTNANFIAIMLQFFGIISKEKLDGFLVYFQSDYDFIRAFFTLVVCSLLGISVAILTTSRNNTSLMKFYNRVRPGGWWFPISGKNPEKLLSNRNLKRLGSTLIGISFIYTLLFGLLKIIIGQTLIGFLLLIISVFAGYLTVRNTTKAFIEK